jgi:Tfp pilus assembly protein PilN
MPIRIPVNLATEPFRRVRAVVVGAAALSLVLVLVLAFQILLIASEHSQAADSRALLDSLNSRLRTVSLEQQKLDNLLRLPENAEVLDRSVFLNFLIEHKAISWTKLFADLETVMPRDVRLMSVRLPQVDAQNHVFLDMTVAAKEPLPILEFIKRLESSKQFSGTQLLATQPPNQNEPFIRSRMSVSYAQTL